MRVVLAGASGQLGQALVPLLEQAGIELVTVRRRLIGAGPNAVHGDITRPRWGIDDLTPLAGADVLVNLAGQTDWAATHSSLWAANTGGARHGAELAVELGRADGRATPVPYVFASSVYVAGGALGCVSETRAGPDRHHTAYEQSKWQAEGVLERHAGPALTVRLPALIGDSVTGRTVRRNSLYQLVDRLHDLPWRALPLMRQARLDALPRDIAARTLLDVVTHWLASGAGEPRTVQLCLGEDAPLLSEFLAVGRRLGARQLGSLPRLVPVSAAAVLWASQNPGRFVNPSAATRNAITGWRYIALERWFDRARLRTVTDDVPAVSAETLARVVFDLPAAARRTAEHNDPSFARFGA